MATLTATVPLKGQSRSAYCGQSVTGSKTRCHRLDGHKGDHRSTLKGGKVATTAKVTILPEGESKRQVAAGRRRTKRAKAAPATSRETQADKIAAIVAAS